MLVVLRSHMLWSVSFPWQRKRPPTGKPDPYTSMCVVISGLWQLALSYLLPPLWMGWPRRASLQDDVQHLMWFCLQEIV